MQLGPFLLGKLHTQRRIGNQEFLGPLRFFGECGCFLHPIRLRIGLHFSFRLHSHSTIGTKHRLLRSILGFARYQIDWDGMGFQHFFCPFQLLWKHGHVVLPIQSRINFPYLILLHSHRLVNFYVNINLFLENQMGHVSSSLLKILPEIVHQS